MGIHKLRLPETQTSIRQASATRWLGGVSLVVYTRAENCRAPVCADTARAPTRRRDPGRDPTATRCDRSKVSRHACNRADATSAARASSLSTQAASALRLREQTVARPSIPGASGGLNPWSQPDSVSPRERNRWRRRCRAGVGAGGRRRRIADAFAARRLSSPPLPVEETQPSVASSVPLALPT